MQPRRDEGTFAGTGEPAWPAATVPRPRGPWPSVVFSASLATMDRGTFRRLMDAVGLALERPTADRDAVLSAALADDATLLDEARALAAEAEGSAPGDMTGRVASVVDRAAADALGATVAPPERVGPYRIVRVLGRGGMGVVYCGRQEEPFRRDVAIKVIRAGAADPETLARFATERQVLASMQHAAIARVLDAGATDDGLPYFVMELVEGLPMTDYCARERLSLDARLELFRVVCAAVQHAHQRGIIHRDLKPSNVLVTTVDGRATPKVIDFGIAKAVAGMLPVDSVHTQAGAIVGTVEYMSPEQLRGAVDAVDVRSDVYSLGVILYELVCGRHPFADAELHRAGLLEAQRIILDTDPPRPSRHPAPPAGEATLRPKRTAWGRRRRLRELDWIVMKALEKDPQRRYQSALALVADLEQFARHEPVSAGPPGLAYRAGKFARRHRVAVAASAVIALTLLASIAAATRGFVRATAEARRADAVSGFLAELLASVRPDNQGRAVTVREVLDSARTRLLAGEFASDPATESSVALVIGQSYESLGRYTDARELTQRSLDIRRRLYAPDDHRVFEALYRLGTVLWQQGALDEALAVRQTLARMTARTADAAPLDHAESLSNLGNTYADLGRLDLAVQELSQAVALARRATGDSAQLGVARYLNNLGSVYFDQREYGRAANAFREALAIRSRLVGPTSDVYAITLVNLGNATRELGRLQEAERLLRRAVTLEERIFGADHPRTGYAYSALGEVLLREGRPQPALEAARRALAIRIATEVGTYWRVAAARRQLAEALIALRRLPEAEAELRNAWAGLVAAGETTMPPARRVAEVMARLQRELGARERAATWARRAGGGRGSPSGGAP